MKLRKKTAIVIGLTIIGLISILYTASRMIIVDSFNNLEVQNTKEEVTLVKGIISDDISALDSKLSDWAQWDDSYGFGIYKRLVFKLHRGNEGRDCFNAGVFFKRRLVYAGTGYS